MNAYQLSLVLLFTALSLEAVASALALRCWLHREQPVRLRRCGLGLSAGALLFAIHHGRSLEIAAQTGLYDLFQASLALPAGLALALAARQLRALINLDRPG